MPESTSPKRIAKLPDEEVYLVDVGDGMGRVEEDGELSPPVSIVSLLARDDWEPVDEDEAVSKAETREEARARVAEWRRRNKEPETQRTGVTEAEARAIDRYQRNGYKTINAWLRGEDQQLSPRQRATAKADATAIHGALAKAPPLPRSMTLYRGSPEYRGLRVGDELEDFGFLSMSENQHVPLLSSSGPVVKIELPKGTTHVMHLGAGSLAGYNEQEWLMRGIPLRVARVEHGTPVLVPADEDEDGSRKYSEVMKAGPPNEPRDDHGRWIAAWGAGALSSSFGYDLPPRQRDVAASAIKEFPREWFDSYAQSSSAAINVRNLKNLPASVTRSIGDDLVIDGVHWEGDIYVRSSLADAALKNTVMHEAVHVLATNSQPVESLSNVLNGVRNAWRHFGLKSLSPGDARGLVQREREWKALPRDDRPVTPYAAFSSREYIAETIAHYLHSPDMLKHTDPGAFAAIHAAMAKVQKAGPPADEDEDGGDRVSKDGGGAGPGGVAGAMTGAAVHTDVAGGGARRRTRTQGTVSAVSRAVADVLENLR